MHALLQPILPHLPHLLLGKETQVRLALCCLLARGHLLIEDVPGVGKTTLAQGLARVLGLSMRRVQFTSDLLPADILGSTIFDREAQRFVFHPGPIFSPVLLADEVNRATPRTQSALLEAMEENQVSIDGVTHPLPEPFFVIATQNPRHQIGTYPLPESQLDRFLLQLEIGFPGREAEREMLAGAAGSTRRRTQEIGFTSAELLTLQQAADQVHVAPPLREYLLDLLSESRRRARSGAGLSPRAGLALQRAARAWALLEGRDMVLPEDVQAVGRAVMAHRLAHAEWSDGRQGSAAAEELLRTVPVP